MKKIKFLSVLLFLTVSLPSYCQDWDDDDDNWPVVCNYLHISANTGSEIKLINSLRNDPSVKLIKGKLNLSLGREATIQYKHLQSVSLGQGSEADFIDCLTENNFYLRVSSGSEAKFKKGADCKVLYIEAGAGSEVKFGGKTTAKTFIIDLGTGSEVKIMDLQADTLVITGSGIGSELKINGNVGTLIYCKNYSTEIRGRFRTKRLIDDGKECKEAEKQAKEVRKSLRP